jgi:putative acetyltransferase
MSAAIRPYDPADATATRRVFVRAIRNTASADYTPEQIDAWAADVDPEVWAERRITADTWVAELGGEVVGFVDIDESGYIDMLFVDPGAARIGVATALLAHVRGIARRRHAIELTVNASHTARPFFGRHGFSVVAEQLVERHGTILGNTRMSGPVDWPSSSVRNSGRSGS